MAARKKKRTTRKKSGVKGGRPKFEFTPEALQDLELLAKAANTIGDISKILGVSKRTLERRIEWDDELDSADQDEVAVCYRKAVADRHNNLRVAQFATALRGSATMQIWLGKQELGQRDYKQIEVTGPEGGPIRFDTELDAELEKKLLEFARSTNPSPLRKGNGG